MGGAKAVGTAQKLPHFRQIDRRSHNDNRQGMNRRVTQMLAKSFFTAKITTACYTVGGIRG